MGAPWTVAILSYIEEIAQAQQLPLDQAYVSGGGTTPLGTTYSTIDAPQTDLLTVIKTFKCPSGRRPERRKTLSKATSYLACQGGGITKECNNTTSGGDTVPNERAFYSNGMMYVGSKVKPKDVIDGTSKVGIDRRKQIHRWSMGMQQPRLTANCTATTLGSAYQQINYMGPKTTLRRVSNGPFIFMAT